MRVSAEAGAHDVKLIRPFFDYVRDDSKPFEIRKNDRVYHAGDVLLLREWRPNLYGGAYTGRYLYRRVTILVSRCEGLEEGYVVLGLAPLEPEDLERFEAIRPEPRDASALVLGEWRLEL